MEYPKPSTPYVGHSSLYFGTEEQIHSPASFGNFDRGEISIAHGGLTFHGMNVLVECPNVSQIRLVRKVFPWLILLPMIVLAGIVVYANSPIPFTWRQPLPYILGTILLVGSLLHVREMWVEVSYDDIQGPRRAYFRERSGFFLLTDRRNYELLVRLRNALPTHALPKHSEDDTR
ncbi:MAG: hypothetical protein JNL58_30335 [Planctomyces sp.]|nr:hypothetical protein [Planctomyces sp.]